MIIFRLKLLLNKVGFKNTYLPLVGNNIHDSLVMLMEQDIPTNYEEAMVDLSTRNDYESQNPILSYISDYLNLIE